MHQFRWRTISSMSMPRYAYMQPLQPLQVGAGANCRKVRLPLSILPCLRDSAQSSSTNGHRCGHAIAAKSMELDDSEDRSDGVDFEQGCTEDAQGSCRWRDGATEVVATVDGPTHRTDRAASQDPGRGGLEIRAQLAARSSVKDRNAAEKAVEDALHASLGAALDAAACPRRVTTVFCLVIADDQTAAQRCALNAASLALLDARAPMRAIPLAVSVDCGGCAVDVGPGRGARRRRGARARVARRAG